MRNMMQQNFPYPLQFLYLQLRLTYSCHCVKERKSGMIFLLRMKQSPNLLVVQIYPLFALRICVLVCASWEQFPNKSVFIKIVSVTCRNLQSMFFYIGGYVFHRCPWDNGERNGKSIQHQNRNYKLDLIYSENWIWVHVNDLSQNTFL